MSQESEQVTKTVTGKVEAVSVKDEGSDKQRYGLNVKGDWFNEFGLTSVGKGDTVKIEYFTNSYGNQIQSVNVLAAREDESTEGDDSSKSQQAQESAQKFKEKENGGGENSVSSTGSNTYISKQDRIMTQVAFKKACENVETSPNQNIDKHFNEVKSLSNGYKQIIEELIQE